MPEGQRGGFPTYWHAFGSGAHHALMLHCALAHGGAWRAVAERLAPAWRTEAPDMPGHGRSADWDQRCDLHDQVTAIARDFLQPGIHLVGHSFGATVALRLAQETAVSLASLTLIEPVLFAAARGTEAFEAHLSAGKPFSEALQAQDWDRAARMFTGAWGDGRAWERLPPAQRAGNIQRIPMLGETERCLHEDTAGILRPGGLETITVPVRLIRGTDTMPIMTAIHDALDARLPDAQQVIVPGAGHMLPVTHPEAVQAELVRLVA